MSLSTSPVLSRFVKSLCCWCHQYECCHRKSPKTTFAVFVVCTCRSLASLRERSARLRVEVSARKTTRVRAKSLRLHELTPGRTPPRLGYPRAAWLAGCVGKRTKSLLFEGKETRQKHSGVGFPYSVRTLPSSPALARNHRPASPTLWGTSVVAQRTSLPTNTALCRSSIARPPRSARVPLAANNPQCTPSSSSHPS